MLVQLLLIVQEEYQKPHFDKLKMDEDDINDFIQRCAFLKHKLLGIFAANKFPKSLNQTVS